jgi:hypothetical protein
VTSFGEVYVAQLPAWAVLLVNSPALASVAEVLAGLALIVIALRRAAASPSLASPAARKHARSVDRLAIGAGAAFGVFLLLETVVVSLVQGQPLSLTGLGALALVIIAGIGMVAGLLRVVRRTQGLTGSGDEYTTGDDHPRSEGHSSRRRRPSRKRHP